MRKSILFLPLFVFVSAQAQFKNVKITDAKAGAFPSPSVAVNQRDPMNIVAAVAPDMISYTVDAGMNWNSAQSASTLGTQGRPYLLSDTKGHFYYFHETKTGDTGFADRLVIEKTTDEGKTWKDQGLILAPSKDLRHQAIVLHPRKQSLYATWTQFDKYESSDTTLHSAIYFSRSGGGEKWSEPLLISNKPGGVLDNERAPIGSTPVVDMNGRVFIAWAQQGKLMLDRSFDGGDRWLRNDIVLNKSANFSCVIPGLGKISSVPSVMMDNSGSPYHGNIYIVWADQTNGTDDTDIWLTHTNNGGDNWSVPARVNKDEAGSHQFMPSIAVDQETGYVYITYYDRREYDDERTDVLLSYSMDGGNHFKEVKISDSPFVPSVNNFRDAIRISASNGTIVPVWVRADGERLSVWTSIVSEDGLKKIK